MAIGRPYLAFIPWPNAHVGLGVVLGAIWQHAGEEHLLRRGGLLQGGPRQAQRTLLLTRATRGGALLHPSGSLVRDADAGLGGTLVWWWWRNVQSMPSDIILSDLYYKVGSFLEDMGKYDGALGIYLEARFLYDKASQPIYVARAECAVAHIYHLKGAYKQAQQLFKDALERFKKEKGTYIYPPPHHHHTHDTHTNTQHTRHYATHAICCERPCVCVCVCVCVCWHWWVGGYRRG